MRFLFSLLFAAVAFGAQASRAQGNVFLSVDNPPGGSFQYQSVGAGADVFLRKGPALSPSLGYLFSCDNGGGGIAIATVNGSYHFLRGKGRAEPFVTAGYGALANFTGGISLLNYGGGVQYWFRINIGVRVEILNFQHRQ